MDASVVIRTKDEAHSIAATLKKVSEQVFDGGYEIIIVDSESTDSTLDIVSKFNTRLIQIAQKEFTYGRSLNIGASNANGRFIVNLSAHAVPKDNKWLTSLITPFEDSEVAGVYGRQLSDGRVNPFEALQKELFFGQEKITFNMKNKGMLKRIHFSNSNSAIRKDVWQRFKFNEEVPYAEDILWQTAVTEARFSIVYAADAAVYHTHRISIGGAYKDSRNCAYALALMKQKRQSVPRIIFDVGILLCLIPNSIFQNLSFMRQNNYIENLKIAPLYVMCGWFGWLAGRIKYRLKK
jgi:rhamnosyltransferase